MFEMYELPLKANGMHLSVMDDMLQQKYLIIVRGHATMSPDPLEKWVRNNRPLFTPTLQHYFQKRVAIIESTKLDNF